jgi:hypothetical protein
VGGGTDLQQRALYDVAPDGRFLVNTLTEVATPLSLLQNWRPAVQAP